MQPRSAIIAVLLAAAIEFVQPLPLANSGQCVWYGQCHKNSLGSQNCAYTGPPKPMDPTSAAYKTFASICPRTAADGKAAGGLCCDASMIDAMVGSLQLGTQFFNVCPSCSMNFNHTWCESTCSPYQSRFLEVTATEKNTAGQDYITAMDYYVTQTYAENLFNSCHYVHAGPGVYALIYFCAGKQFKDCDYRVFINYMGANPFAPLKINFVLTNSTSPPPANITPLGDTLASCAVSPGYGLPACQCEDCPSEEGCPTTTTTTTKKP